LGSKTPTSDGKGKGKRYLELNTTMAILGLASVDFFSRNKIMHRHGSFEVQN